MDLKPAAFYLLAPTCLNMFKRRVCSRNEKNCELGSFSLILEFAREQGK